MHARIHGRRAVGAAALAAAVLAQAAAAQQYDFQSADRTRGQSWFAERGDQGADPRAGDPSDAARGFGTAPMYGDRWFQPAEPQPRAGAWAAPLDGVQRQRRMQPRSASLSRDAGDGTQGVVLRGEVERFGRVRLADAPDAHTLMGVRLADGRSALVDLGPRVEPSDLNLAEGDRIAVRGWRGSIEGTPVLIATRLRVGGEAETIRRPQRVIERDQGFGAAGMHRMGQQQRVRAGERGMMMRESAGQRGVRRMVMGWPSTSREAAEAMLEKYGEPDGVTAEMLVWNETGPFVKTIVHRHPVEHRFPKPHEDVLQQFVNYEVPPEKMDELAEYDGSVTVYRTAGLMSAMCDREAMNYLALNLAHRLVEDEISVEEARQRYAEVAEAYMDGERPEIVESLEFETPGRFLERTNAPDEPAERFASE